MSTFEVLKSPAKSHFTDKTQKTRYLHFQVLFQYAKFQPFPTTMDHIMENACKNIFCPTKVFCSEGLQGRTYIADANVMVLQNLKREDRSLSGYYGSFIFIFIRPQKMDHMWPSLPGSRHLNLHFPHELLLLQVHWHQDTQKS